MGLGEIMRSPFLARPNLTAGLLSALWFAFACSSDSKPDPSSGTQGANLDASAAALDAGAPGLDAGAAGLDARSNGTTPSDHLESDGAVAHGDPGAPCNQVDLKFEPRLPTVFILVDRSSSMFENMRWDPLKAGVLLMVQSLQHAARFGFSSYTGQNGGVCPDVSTATTLAQDNFAMIELAYNALGAPTYKGETPTARAIDQTVTVLAADTYNGPKFILLVTDGEPDFCDDANVTCARDAVVGAVQAAHAKGVGTFIFSVGDVDQSHLADVANAGTGQNVEDHQLAVAQQCTGVAGTYATPAGNAPFFEPNVNDQQRLADTLASVVSSARSCVFDLQGQIKIDLSEASSGMVALDGKPLPYGDPNGFRMNTATQLELLGDACQQLLKSQDTQSLSINFPCQAVIAI
jgi:uncharacterized protein YegL